jgi:hypothetical protein
MRGSSAFMTALLDVPEELGQAQHLGPLALVGQ